MQFRPCIDIHNGRVKQIVGSSLSDNGSVSENFVSDKDSSYYAKLYKEYNLTGGHVIILNKAGTVEYEASKNAAFRAFEAFEGGLQIGGGINDLNAKEFIDKGASHVIVTSFIIVDGKISFERLEKLKRSVSKEHIVLDLSCRRVNDKYMIATDRWQRISDVELNEALLDKLADYCDEYLIHAVDVEGKQNGPESDVLKEISKFVPEKVTYAGGIHSYEDIDIIEKAGNKNVNFTIGSALDIFGGKLSFETIAKKYS